MSHILIIEDEKDLREALETALNEEGYDIESCETSAEGLERVTQKKPDLILLDIMTHSLHGVSFLQKLRALPTGHNDSKVIVLTNLDTDITREQIATYTVDDYIIKAHASLQEIVRIAKETLAHK